MTKPSSTIDSLACLAVRAVGGFVCRLPAGAAYWLGRRLGDVARLAKPSRAHVAYVNLAFAFGNRCTPRQRLAIVRRSFQHLGEGLIEMLRLPLMDAAYVERHIRVEGMAHLEEALKRQRGIIFLTGHLGNWELSSIVAALQGYPILALAREQKYPKLNRLLNSYREAKGCRIVPKGMALRAMVRALHRNQIIGIVADQDAGRAGVFLDLFGRPASTAPGPVAMALRTGATVLPVFIRRLDGPRHRITLEPTLDLSAGGAAAIRSGLATFVRHLERHVSAEPGQWLWAHKRWKTTPAKTALVLSDGKAGHLKQSLAVVEALRGHRPLLQARTAEVRFRGRFRRLWLALQARWLRSPVAIEDALARTLTPASMEHLRPVACDVVISCGASVGVVNVLVARASRAKAVAVMRPSLVGLRRFDRVIVPAHDRVAPRPNVTVTEANLASVDAAAMQRGLAQLQASGLLRPSAPACHVGETAGRQDGRRVRIGLLLGGDTADYRLPPALARRVLEGVLAACESLDAECWVTTSRRTPAEVETLCAAMLERHPRCRVLVLAHRANPEGTVEGILGASDVVLVSGESTSMVSEAVASGRRVVVFTPEAVGGQRTKHRRFLDALERQGYLRVVAADAVGAALAAARRAAAPPPLPDAQRLRAATASLL